MERGDYGNCDFYDSKNCTWQSPWCICIFLSDKQFGRGTWKILVLPRCCGDEQLLSHWVWRLQERQLLSGTFGSSGWIGFLRTVCSEFQLLSPKCKVLSQKSCSWITSVKLGGSRRPLSTSGIGRSHSRPPQLIWIVCCFVPTFCPPESFVFSWPFLASQQSLIFSSRDHRVRPQSLTNLFIVH